MVGSLRRQPDLADVWVPRILSRRYDPELRAPDDKAGYWPDFVAVIAATVGIGGFWLAVFKGRLMAAPMLPRHAPSLEKKEH